jgi:ring-1,2-phenylacetyl-CoA epoxidase subunit PaaE
VAVRFHKLIVKNIRKETEDAVSVEFGIPVNLESEFYFKAGQNITIKFFAGGEEIRRSYSICSAPFEDELRIAIRKIENGVFSTYANDTLREGDTLEVLAPTGFFTTETDPAYGKSYFFFAAGSGITPVISIIKTILFAEPKSNISLFYGNRIVASIMFKEELESLKDEFIDRLLVTYILSREATNVPLNNGRIDEDKCKQLAKIHDFQNGDAFFICGPENMIYTVKDFLESEGIEQNRIHFELFTTPKRKPRQVVSTVNNGKKSAFEITVKTDGRLFTFMMADQNASILEAGLAHGLELPFSCKGGVCCTCKSKLIEGKVEMEENFGLEPDELDAGFILTCQSHPITGKVKIDFDVRS